MQVLVPKPFEDEISDFPIGELPRASSGKCQKYVETRSLHVSKPDKTAFCSLGYSLSHDILLVIYSENKDFPGFILLEKHLRSLDIPVNLFERMEA